jgi:chromosome segregation ATPase
VLYLAEVQRKARVIGGGKAELKLLACQRSEQSWSAVPGEEIIQAPDDANYNAGVLVMVEVSANKQVQRHSEAGRQLVSILQNFTRLQEKSKTQEEEIEQWKQSLTYQSQELNRREMEMEARQDELQQIEEELAKLEQQRQEVEGARGEVDRLREEFERKTQELEGAWAHLRGEMDRFQERQAEMQQSATLDEQQAYQLQELLNRLASVVTPTEAVREQLNFSFEVVSQQQGTVEHHYQELDQQRADAQQRQNEVEGQMQEIQRRWQEWHQAQEQLEQARAELRAKQSVLALTQEYERSLAEQFHSQETLHEQVYRLAEGSDHIRLGSRVDLAALENMPLDELKTLTQEMEKDLEKVSRFVSSQEEELSLQQQTIDNLKEQIPQANEYDRLQLEAELADEQESYKMLNETLVGQRRNLHEREAILKQHQMTLNRRSGLVVDNAPESQIDLAPVLTQMDALRHQQSEELRKLREQIQQLRGDIEQAQGEVDRQVAEQNTKLNELKDLERHWQSQRAGVAELWGKVNTSQALLQLLQDGTQGVQQKLEAIAQSLAQFQESSDYQLQAIAELRQVIANLTGNQSPEYVAS